MSWICKNCSHSNRDEDIVCFVCDTPREIIEKSYADSSADEERTEHLAAEEHSSGGETHTADLGIPVSVSVSHATRGGSLHITASKKIILNKIFSIFTILCLFAAGQVVEYFTYFNYDYVLILTDFAEAVADNNFDIRLFLIITSVLGVISAGLYIWRSCYFIDKNKYLINWIMVTSFAVSMGIYPSISVPVSLIFAVIFIIVKLKRGAKVLTILFAVAMASILIVVLPVAKTLSPTYIVTIYYQDGTERVEQFKISSGDRITELEIPSRIGYTFLGIFDEQVGGTQYYDCNMNDVRNRDVEENITLYAQWSANAYTITFDKQGGTGGTYSVLATFDTAMPNAEAPLRAGYTFSGYFDDINGGIQYYNSSMQGLANWDKPADSVLYAHWSANTYMVTLDLQGGTGGTSRVTATYGQRMPSATMPEKAGYDFNGFYTGLNGVGTQYYSSTMSSSRAWDIAGDTTLYAYWTVSDITASASPSSLSDIGSSKTTTINVSGGSGSYSYMVMNNPSGVSCSFSGNVLTLKKTSDSASGSVTIRVTDNVTNAATTCTVRYTTTGGCVATGTLITLSDGRQVPVERLNGDEMLLVWNMYTGEFDSAPVLFVDQDEYKEYEVINLKFSDGTEVKVITEHAFWDFNLNKYVFLDKNASEYIGHWFNKQTGTGNNFSWTKVQLVGVTICHEYSIAWSPVTYGHLCYYVNGMLSMPGNTEGLINIFEVDSEQMAYDTDQMREDIELYGLYTYEEFNGVMPVSEVLFKAFNGQYLKVALGKGILDWERIKELINRYDIS